MDHVDFLKEDADIKTKLSQFSVMLNASEDCIKLIDCHGRLLQMNKAGCLALGLPLLETKFGMKWLDLLPKDVRARGLRALAAAKKGQSISFPGRSEIPGQKPIYWDNMLTPMHDTNGIVVSILCVSRNITKQREVEEKLRKASNIDPLTGLPNRRLFKIHANAALKRSIKTGRSLGMIFIDIDLFKTINDDLGHAAGDFLLRKLARRFKQAMRPDEFVARLGGDEFVVIAPLRAGADELYGVMLRLKKSLSKPVNYKGSAIEVSLSFGGAVSSPELTDISALMRASDTALYEVKLTGRNDCKIFQPNIG